MRGKGTADPSASNEGPSASAPSTAAAPRACEACDAAPGMPFCRVEWSFLCASCGPALHRNSWIVAVPPFPPGTGPTGPTTPSSTSSNSANPPPPCYLPPFLQMPLPPQAHMLPSNPAPSPNPVKRRRRRRTREEMLAPAPTDTDTDRAGAETERMARYGQNRKTRLRPSVPAPPSSDRTDSGNAYTELLPGAEETMIPIAPESTEEEVQVDAMEKLATEMDPPPTELDEIEEAIAAEGEP